MPHNPALVIPPERVPVRTAIRVRSSTALSRLRSLLTQCTRDEEGVRRVLVLIHDADTMFEVAVAVVFLGCR